MATEYVSGADILAHVAGSGAASTDPADVDWADDCAAAVNAAIDEWMTDVTVDPGSNAEAELIRAGTQDGAAAYLERKTPHGVLSVGPDGEAVRLGRDIVRALAPVFARYAAPSIG